MTADIIHLRPRSDAPVQRIPRPESGLRPTKIEEDGLRIKRAAKRAADEMAGGKAKRAQVHRDLHLALAARVEGFAGLARTLALECGSHGHIAHQATLADLADILELMSCEIEAEAHP